MHTQTVNTLIKPSNVNIGKISRAIPVANDRKITSPVGTYWVETLSNPTKPNIWAGNGPKFDSDHDNWMWATDPNFWRTLDNGYTVYYKNDAERITAMILDSRIDMTQSFNGSRNRGSMSSNMHDWDDGNRSDCKRGRNNHYKTKRGLKLSLVCPQTTRKMKTDVEWAKEARKG